MGKKSDTIYTVESRVSQVILKLYDEQLVNSFGTDDEIKAIDALSEKISKSNDPSEREDLINTLGTLSAQYVDAGDYYSKFANHIQSIPYKSDAFLEINASQCFYLGVIRHDKDTSGDFFKPEIEKRHYHVACKTYTLPGSHVRRVRLGTLLNYLKIKFRDPYDKSIIMNHGVEVCNDFNEFLAYMTHSTKASIADGKYPYPDTDLVTNFPDDVRIKLLANTSASIGKISTRDWESICSSAFEYGSKHIKFSQFLKDLKSYKVQRAFAQSSADAKMAIDAYRDGRKEYFKENRRSFHRDVILISGSYGVGKSFTSREALLDLGFDLNDIFEVGDKTAKFDDYDDEDVLIFDDNMMSQALNICDSSGITKLYQRGHNRASYIYDGHLVIVCTNLTLDLFCLRARGYSCTKSIEDIDNSYDRETVYALRSRFAYLRVDPDTYQAEIKCYAKRDTGDKLDRHKSFVNKFTKAYNRSVVAYRGDLSKPIDPDLPWTDPVIPDCTKLDVDALPWA